MKQGVATILDRLSEHHPEFTHAVVYDTDRWEPTLPPEGSRWDYEPFTSLKLARELLADDPPHDVRDIELWERVHGHWTEHRGYIETGGSS